MNGEESGACCGGNLGSGALRAIDDVRVDFCVESIVKKHLSRAHPDQTITSSDDPRRGSNIGSGP